MKNSHEVTLPWYSWFPFKTFMCSLGKLTDTLEFKNIVVYVDIDEVLNDAKIVSAFFKALLNR